MARSKHEWAARLREVATGLPHEDRPIAAIVACDPAGTRGQLGLAVGRTEPAVAPYWAAAGGHPHAMVDWLVTQLGKLQLQPGVRVLFVAEADAFRSYHVARELGIGVGYVEGWLVDTHHIPANSRVDVPSSAWRQAHRKTWPAGRPAKKRLSVKLAAAYAPGAELSVDAAEALLLAVAAERWLARALAHDGKVRAA